MEYNGTLGNGVVVWLTGWCFADGNGALGYWMVLRGKGWCFGYHCGSLENGVELRGTRLSCVKFMGASGMGLVISGAG